MTRVSREFQVFAKPVGSVCNLACHYCYYHQKDRLCPENEPARMPDEVLEQYIVQHIDACPESLIRFSWHGGEPTVLGLEYFRKIVSLQRKHKPPNRCIANGIQTNGTLLDEEWCRFLAYEGFVVGLSLDGPRDLHDLCRVSKDGNPSYEKAVRGYELLQEHGVYCDILCVVNAHNVREPISVYRFFKEIGAPYVSFLPMVERQPECKDRVGPLTVPTDTWGTFLCSIFDEWVSHDIGRIKVQIFEEATRTAFGQDHSLCIFRPVCGDVPVVEHNGDFFSCDHFVDPDHRIGNIMDSSLEELLERPAQRGFGKAKLETLPEYCRACDVREMCHGGCPKNRLAHTPDGEAGLNYLCAGYKRFFTHCQPFVSQVAIQWRREKLEERLSPVQTVRAETIHKPGRNAPCPCGSGLKYKKCCMDK